MCRIGQNRIYTPYMAVYLVISCQEYRVYALYIYFWPTLMIHVCYNIMLSREGWQLTQ